MDEKIKQAIKASSRPNRPNNVFEMEEGEFNELGYKPLSPEDLYESGDIIRLSEGFYALIENPSNMRKYGKPTVGGSTILRK